MLEKHSAPMTTHESGAKAVLLRGEVGRDERKDIQRNAVDAGKGVPPFSDGCKCGRNVPVELRNRVQGEAANRISQSSSSQPLATHGGENATRLNSSFRAKVSCGSESPFPG